MDLILNPDSTFARNKRKAIKKNNGFCLNCPKTPEWKCPCAKFRNQPYSGWCDEGLYYKNVTEESDDPDVEEIPLF